MIAEKAHHCLRITGKRGMYLMAYTWKNKYFQREAMLFSNFTNELIKAADVLFCFLLTSLMNRGLEGSWETRQRFIAWWPEEDGGGVPLSSWDFSVLSFYSIQTHRCKKWCCSHRYFFLSLSSPEHLHKQTQSAVY